MTRRPRPSPPTPTSSPPATGWVAMAGSQSHWKALSTRAGGSRSRSGSARPTRSWRPAAWPGWWRKKTVNAHDPGRPESSAGTAQQPGDQLTAAGDAELVEHRPQVLLHRVGRDVQVVHDLARGPA